MWYCLSGNRKYGPFSVEDAHRFIQTRPDCLVWREGMPEWTPAERFAALANRDADAPPSGAFFDSGLDFKIRGDDMQYVEITLNAGESVIAEPGAMIYKGIFVKPAASLGTKRQGLVGRLFGAGKRVLSGERAFLTVFENTGGESARVAFSAPYPGKIIPVSLAGIGGELICRRDSFLCAQSDVDIGVFFQKKLSTALFGGHGFVMQRLTGDGVAFIHAGGTIGEIELADGESVQVDAGCLAAFQPSVRFDVCGAGDLKTQLFGGSGLFYADLQGPGKIWVQSLPFSRLAGRLGDQIAPKRK
ncbi:MAG TPA: TIGR00266 family protein [Alphaproteobacteria bacterium]|nr:TIGR00266 family protein [Alphaproteobacteria bacterium]